jgi:nucleotide-binding universal stress UspA family protein
MVDAPTRRSSLAGIAARQEADMEFRTVLVALSGGSASAGAAEIASRLAHRFASHLEAIHVRIDPGDLAVISADPGGGPLSFEIADKIERQALEAAAGARDIFDAAVKRHALPLQDAPPPLGTDPALLRRPSACWREEMGYGGDRIADRARLFDLVILGRSGRVVGEPAGEAIEKALLASGRPVLVAPAQPRKALGDVIALAWNASPEAARALAAAMPFLVRAREVHILSLGEAHAPDLARHLAWHGIRATASAVLPAERVAAGELLLAAARDHGADLLVMGGYGHSPWREMLFGGATRQILGTSLLPLFLAH